MITLTETTHHLIMLAMIILAVNIGTIQKIPASRPTAMAFAISSVCVR